MIRLILKTVAYAPVADSVGEIFYATYDIEIPELEERLSREGTYSKEAIVGAEIIKGGKG